MEKDCQALEHTAQEVVGSLFKECVDMGPEDTVWW